MPARMSTVTRAALYLRISQDNTGESLGVTRQQEDCAALAVSLNWEVVGVYTDNDISAYKMRPQYMRMLADVEAGKIDAIIAWAPDRIYRRIADLEALITVIEAHRTEIRTVKAGDLDLSSAYGRMIARILGSVAAGEGEIKSERWKRAWRQNREAGHFAQNGRRTFGYTPDGQVIEVEAEIARWMADQILDGTPILTVCRELYDLGVTTTHGNPWTPAGLKRFLLNPRIAGWSTMGRYEPTGTIDKKTKKPHERYVWDIVSEGNWEPLLARETYESVKAILSSRSRPYVPRKALLTKLVVCGMEGCGHNLITSGQKGQRTYRCPNRPNMRGCGRVSCNADPIERMVEAYARERLNDPRVRQAIGALRSDGDSGPYAELAALELRITELEKQLDDPSLSLNAILRAIDRAKERQAELQNQVNARANVVIPASDADWPTDIITRRQLVDLVVEKVILYPATKPSRYGFDYERVEIIGR